MSHALRARRTVNGQPRHRTLAALPIPNPSQPPVFHQCSRLTRFQSRRQLTWRIAAVAEQEEQESEEERVTRIRTEVTRRIKKLGDKGRSKEAIQELASLAVQGVQPDTLAATALVRACIKDMELAENIFQELFGDFLQPDEISFAVLLRGYGMKSPPDWVGIDRVLSTMRNKYGLEPTATSYNVLLEVCNRTNDLDRGEEVIDRMSEDGVEPDEFTEAAVASRRALRSYLRKTFS